MREPPAALSDAADILFSENTAHGVSLALVVQHHGDVVFERYGVQPETIFGPGGPVDADTPIVSWSMAKSITHAIAGIAVGDGLLDLDAPAPVAQWKGTEKEPITLQQLLEMRPGLLFVEDYVDDAVSHCLEMLYGSGAQDMAAYAASLPLIHPPGDVWNYSSGTTNIVSRIVGESITPEGGDHEKVMEAYLRDQLFGAIGMTTADPRFDPAGTFIGSSYVYATGRDFAKFGQLYLDDGVCAGERILPEGWAAHASELTASDPAETFDYGRHWWLWRPGDDSVQHAYGCHGYEGQYIVVVPDRDLVVVHLGKSPIDQRPPLIAQLRRIIDAFAS